MVNINSISAAQSSVKLQALRIQSEHKKQEKSQARDSERRDSISEMREQLAKLRSDSKLSLLDGKLRAGKELTRQELEFLKRERPELYEEALEIKRERRLYKKMLGSSKTKRDVRNTHLHKVSMLLSEAGTIKKAAGLGAGEKRELLDKIAKRVAGVQDEYAKFLASDKYARLPENKKGRKGALRKAYPFCYDGIIIDLLVNSGQSAAALSAIKNGMFHTGKPPQPPSLSALDLIV